MVNHREMKRFIEEIRQRWDPQPHEVEYRYPGWNDEGAFTRCIYKEALSYYEPPKPVLTREDPSQAEMAEQVQISPSLDEIMNYVDKPLKEPMPQSKIAEMLEHRKEEIQRQLTAAGFPPTQVSEVKLPADFGALFAITNGINAAGVPKETAYTLLVRPELDHGCYVGPGELPYEIQIRIRHHQERYHEKPIAAWQFGGCEQHRSIFYVLWLPDGSNDISSACWRIWDRIDIEVEEFPVLTEWLKHETEEVESNEGGAMQQFVVILDRYP